MSKIFSTSIQEKDSFIFSKANVERLRDRKQVKDLEKELQLKDIFQQIADKVSLILMFSPTFLGVFDVLTDLLYVTHQNFADVSIQTIFVVFMIFSTLLQFIIWTIFLTVSDIEKKGYDTSSHMTIYIESLAKGQKLKAYKELSTVYLLNSLYFSYRFALRIPLGTLYAIAGQLKILPFYLTYSFANAGDLQYTITEEFIAEYQMKSSQFQKIQQVQNLNQLVVQKNQVLKKMNSALQEWDRDKRKSLRQLRQEIDLTTTDPLTRASIMKNRVYKTDRILDNALFKRFLKIGDLIQAVFESLPMLIIQYINNSMTNSWDSYIAKVSFAFSFVMTFIHACNMIYKLSQGETFPLIRLLQLIKESNAYESQEWLFGVRKPQTFEIQNENELFIYAQAEPRFFENVDRIVLNIQSDQDFITKSVCGKTRLFKYLRLLISKLQKNNTITLDFNDNIALDFDSVQELIQGLKISKAMILMNSPSSLKHLGLDLQGLELGSLEIVDVPKTLESIYFNIGDSSQLEQVIGILLQGLGMLQKLKILYLNFQNTQIQDLDQLTQSLDRLDLNEMELNFDSTLVSCLNGLGNSVGTQVNLQKLTLKLYDMKIDCIKTLAQGFQNLIKLEHLEAYFGKTNIQNVDYLCSSFQRMTHLRHLSLNFGQTQIENLEQFGLGLSYLVNLTYLNLYFGLTKLIDLSHINLRNLVRLTDLTIQVPNTKVKDINSIRLSNLQQIETLKLNFEGTLIQNIQFLTEDIASLYNLKNLNLNLSNTQFSDLDIISNNLSKVSQQLIKFSLNLLDSDQVFIQCQHNYKNFEDFQSAFIKAKRQQLQQ